MEKILVLMSTYNGETYIHEQIDSILRQKDVLISLLVRDDGSTDSTLSILDDYKAKGQLDYYTGENLGPQRSFMHLLQHAPESDYYAFADQDDIWLDDKLSTAVRSIASHNEQPALYFCQTQLVDKNLQPMKSVIIHPRITFGEMLVYKFIGGCTMVLNSALKKAIGQYRPDYLPMHDLWVYSIAHALDAYIFFDAEPHILYRQHGNNTVGQGQGWAYDWKQRLHRFTAQRDERYRQAYWLAQGYNDQMPPHNQKLLALFLKGKHSLAARLRILFHPELRCNETTVQWLFWINVLTNKY